MQPLSAVEARKAETEIQCQAQTSIHSILQLLDTEGTLGKSLQLSLNS